LPFGAASALTQALSLRSDDFSNFAALSAASTGTSFIAGLLSLVVWTIVFLVVPIYVWKGQTVGKKLLNIKIVKASGNQVDQLDILKRYSIPTGLNLVALIPVLGCVACVLPIITLVNLFMLFSDEKRQTIYDKVAETLVVDSK